MWDGNSSVLGGQIMGPPRCGGWVSVTEDGLFQLGYMFLSLGYMGGSRVFGGLYLFGCLLLGFLCQALWGRLSECRWDVVAWGVLLGALCAVQLLHLLLRLWWGAPPRGELGALYQAVFRPLGVLPAVFRLLMEVCGGRIWPLHEGGAYALEQITPIDQLSFLLSGRVRVSLDGQFVQYIFPFQFLDSPEWESLRAAEEGTFQVTLTAETDCRYVAWPRRRLQVLLARDHYVGHLFAVMLGSDIADKLYALNQRLYVKRGLSLDIRLPGLYFALAPPSPSTTFTPFAENHGNQGNSQYQPGPAHTGAPPGGDPVTLPLQDCSWVPESPGEHSTQRQSLC